MPQATTTSLASADQPAGRPLPRDPDALLMTTEAAFLAGLEPRTLEAKRLRGGGPLFVRISARAVRYRRKDLIDWIENRLVRTTSDPGLQS